MTIKLRNIDRLSINKVSLSLPGHDMVHTTQSSRGEFSRAGAYERS